MPVIFDLDDPPTVTIECEHCPTKVQATWQIWESRTYADDKQFVIVCDEHAQYVAERLGAPDPQAMAECDWAVAL